MLPHCVHTHVVSLLANTYCTVPLFTLSFVVATFMVLSFPCSELNAGTLSENSIEDGTELRLVPAIESGVTVSLRLSVCLSTLPVCVYYGE